jgi:hypothetical protein
MYLLVAAVVIVCAMILKERFGRERCQKRKKKRRRRRREREREREYGEKYEKRLTAVAACAACAIIGPIVHCVSCTTDIDSRTHVRVSPCKDGQPMTGLRAVLESDPP